MEFAAPPSVPKPAVASRELSLSNHAVKDEDDILMNVREDLAETFLWWFGDAVGPTVLCKSFNKQGRMILTIPSTIPTEEAIPAYITEDCWKTKWSLSEMPSSDVDDSLRSRWAKLFQEDSPQYECVMTLQPDGLWERLALVVLFGLVPRCLSRDAHQVEALQHKALHYALELVNSGVVAQLPLHFKVPVLQCLGHSSDPDVHQILGNWMALDIERHYLKSHPTVTMALKDLYGNMIVGENK